MNCEIVRDKISDFIDGELNAGENRMLAAHLEACAECAERCRSTRAALATLAALPRVEPRESVAERVLSRLEVESRGPGLALIFRPAWMARPLILPALVPAAMVLVSVLAGMLALEQEPAWQGATGQGRKTAWGSLLAPSGTEGNPLFLSAEVTAPRVTLRSDWQGSAFTDLREESVFLETVVARDGRVADVRVIDGDSRRAEPIADALRHEIFEPGRYRGRPVAVSVYRLISSMEVRANES